MRHPARHSLTQFGEFVLPAGGLLIIFLMLTVLYGIRQVLLEPDVGWNDCVSLILQTFSRVITFRCPGQIPSLILQSTWRTLVLVCASVIISLALGVLIATCQLFGGRSHVPGRCVAVMKIVASPFPSFLLSLIVFFSLRIAAGKNWPQGEVAPGLEFQGIGALITDPRLLMSYIVRCIPPALVLALADGNLLFFVESIRQRSAQIGSAAHVRYLTESGYTAPVIIFKHIIPHTLVDLAYVLKHRFVYLISSAAIVELIFSRPGIAGSLVQAIINGRGTFEYVAEAVWFLSIVVFILVVMTELLRRNASWLIVRGYYPVARTTYDTVRQIRFIVPHLCALFVIAVIAANIAHPVYGQGLFEESVSLPPFVIRWKMLGIGVLTTFLFVSATTVLALAIAVGTGTAAGLLQGPARRILESGVMSAFDLIPKFFVIPIVMTVLSALSFFEGSANRWHCTLAYGFCMVLFCWNETSRSIVNRMRDVERSGAFASATAIGCSMMRKLAVYYSPAIRHEAAIGALNIFLTVLFLECGLAYCGAGLSRWAWNFHTVGSIIHDIINGVFFIPPYGPVLLRYTPAMGLGLLIIVAVATVNGMVERISRRSLT